MVDSALQHGRSQTVASWFVCSCWLVDAGAGLLQLIGLDRITLLLKEHPA